MLDVSGVAFADSSMLNLMLLLRRTDHLVLAGPLPSQPARLLDITQARALFTLAEGIEAARAL
ncbi:hypothetical protein AB0D46_34780 [Streptomyces sp. NPDC048383]|uniref:hypothetical protein n=1 Tax=Streptomyces sp. NPDC048383 TaxID=3155386 RepID=UPI00342FD1BA